MNLTDLRLESQAQVKRQIETFQIAKVAGALDAAGQAKLKLFEARVARLDASQNYMKSFKPQLQNWTVMEQLGPCLEGESAL